MKKLLLVAILSLLFVNMIFTVEARARPELIHARPTTMSSGTTISSQSSGGSSSGLISPTWVWTGQEWIPQPLKMKNGKILDCVKYQCTVFDMDTRKKIPKPSRLNSDGLQSLDVSYAEIDWFRKRI